MILKVFATIGAVTISIILMGIVLTVTCLVWILKVTRPKPATPEFPSAKERRIKEVSESRTRNEDPLRNIDWFQFEKLMELIYTREGFHVERRGGANPDGGIDLVIIRGIERIAVQCKHWKVWDVGVKAVREFLGAMTAERFDAGIFVTSGRISEHARAFAASNHIKVLDQRGINALMARHDAAYDREFRSILDSSDKRCPKCESKMMECVSKKGANIGKKFWGCSAYPRCRYVMKSQEAHNAQREIVEAAL